MVLGAGLCGQLDAPQTRHLVRQEGIANIGNAIGMARVHRQVTIGEPAKPLNIPGLLGGVIQPGKIPLQVQSRHGVTVEYPGSQAHPDPVDLKVVFCLVDILPQ